jgi:hypothetical protein
MVLAIACRGRIVQDGSQFMAEGGFAVDTCCAAVSSRTRTRSAMALTQMRRALGDPQWARRFHCPDDSRGAAIFCLPRQFHVAVVESTAIADVRMARWLFPAYLALISVFVIPIAGGWPPAVRRIEGASRYVRARASAGRRPSSASARDLSGRIFRRNRNGHR